MTSPYNSLSRNLRLGEKYLGLLLSINLRRQLTGPLEVQMHITSKCDLNCLSCFEMTKTPDMDFQLIPGLFNSLDKLKVERVVLAGKRNCLLYSHIERLVDEAKKHRFRLGIILNNLSFTNKNKALLSKFDFFYASILATTPSNFGQVYPSLPFSRYKDSIKLLKSLRHKIIRLNVTLFEQNYRDIISFLKLGEELSLPVYFNKAISDKKPEIEIINQKNYRMLLADARKYASIKGMSTNLSEIGKNKPKFPPCFIGHWQTNISFGGGVYFCCRYPLRMGNIREMPLEDIWYSPLYAKQRSIRSRKESCFKECLFRHIHYKISKFDVTGRTLQNMRQ